VTARFHSLTVSAIEPVTEDAVAITFDVPEPLAEAYRYLPGQHVALRCAIAGDDVRRNYSICAPATSGVLRVGVKRLPGGVFSTYACERLQVGDTIEVLTPAGRFTTSLDPAHTKHYAAIAAGSGITPILSIIATALQVEPCSRATLVYANRTARSIMFLEELEDLRDRHLGRLDILYLLDEETREVELLSGMLDGERLGRILRALVPVDSADEWFVCGPQGFTDAARATLIAHGADPDRVHRELFLASTAPSAPSAAPPASVSTAEAAKATVTLDGRSSVVTVSDSETVLDAVLKVRPDAPFACKGGVCGTCRARLVSGTVDMAQNYALEQVEVAQGYVLACQSRPTSDAVVLDFDG